MGNFQSYSIHQDTPENLPVDAIESRPNPTIAQQGGVQAVTINSSGTVTSTSTTTRFDAGKDLSPYAEDDWRSTARTSYGSPTNDISEDTVVSIGGVQAAVKTFIQAGILTKEGDGYVLAGGEPSREFKAEQNDSKDEKQGPVNQQADSDADLAVMPEEVVDAIDHATAGIPPGAIQAGMALAIASALGDLPIQRVAHGIAQSTGMEPAEAQGRAQFVIDAYQHQTDSYLTSQMGISAEELEGFYDFAREPGNKAELKKALEGQLYGNSMSGWRGLVSRYMDRVAPEAEALKARGFETTVSPEGEPLVRINGSWISTRAAARAGIL